MTQIANPCPHCAADNSPGAAFCEACGKALPLSAANPRIVSGSAMPTSAAGTKLVSDELVKQTKTAANTLLGVGILEMLIGGVFVYIAAENAHAPLDHPVIIRAFAIVGGIAVLFFGLYFWARKSPLPACIVGLVVYATMIVINVVSTLSQEHPTGLGVGLLDLVIVALLVQGIRAGVKHRQLLAQSAQRF